jgi:hypothetical protein
MTNPVREARLDKKRHREFIRDVFVNLFPATKFATRPRPVETQKPEKQVMTIERIRLPSFYEADSTTAPFNKLETPATTEDPLAKQQAIEARVLARIDADMKKRGISFEDIHSKLVAVRESLDAKFPMFKSAQTTRPAMSASTVDDFDTNLIHVRKLVENIVATQEFQRAVDQQRADRMGEVQQAIH